MTDAVLRRPKDLVLAPLARWTPAGVHPIAITLASLVPGLGAAVAAGSGRYAVALALWLVNRLLDGLDGTVARQRERQSDLGAYLDISVDFVVYAAIPIGIAADIGTTGAWTAATVLLATFYLNTISWAYLAAILERRMADTGRPGTATAVVMPSGLVEGTETIVFFCLMLLIPAWTIGLFWAMAAAVVATVLQRIFWAVRNL